MNHTEQAKELRRQWAESDAKRDAGIEAAQNITAVTDIAYAESERSEDAPWHLTDIYYPDDNRTELYPVIVSIHGGGWFYGDKALYSLYTKYLASKGFAVVNFNYRLAPEHRYPCGFADVCRLMHFVAVNGARYRFDLSRLYLVGDSAGAQLASQYAIYAASEEYRRLFEGMETLCAPIPSRVALNCGIYDVDQQEQPIADWYLPTEMTAQQSQSAFHILDYMNERFPETFLMVSVNDGLMPRSRVMKEKLEQLHIPFVYREYGQTNAADGHVFHLNLRSEEGQRCNREEIAFFNMGIN